MQTRYFFNALFWIMCAIIVVAAIFRVPIATHLAWYVPAVICLRLAFPRRTMMLALVAFMLFAPLMARAKTTPAKDDAATLSELEKAKLENCNLKLQMLQNQAEPILAERAQVIKAIEEAHPGYHWNSQTGRLEKIAPPNAGAGAAPPADPPK